ncbi:helix-turn-helix transcriptional regulator [Acinetobacter populi]|uniref:AraC family transcriptional regulator n=1 Tax=Acinetobacter populi TaxID=1582270 RepID=A0A1Z9YYU1_9GAMM|nr:AraC family transcriptional regulator [Acinetobacter populi]OUY07376.1 AraC family transcriptional regulator [Acinetobacter populi]
MDALSKIFDDIHLSRVEYFYLQPRGNWQFQMAEQDKCMIYILLVGSAHLCVNTDQCVELEIGDIIIIPTGKAHFFSAKSCQILSPNTPELSHLFSGHRHDVLHVGEENQRTRNLLLCIRCHMDSIMARPLMQALPKLMRIHNAMGTGAPPWLQVGLSFFALETERIRPGRDTLIDRLVGILLIEGVRDYIEQLNDDQSNWLSALTHPELSNALAAIHGEPEKPWTVADLAQVSCMSRSKFAETFSVIMGETPLAYLAQHRLRLASRYLRESALHVHQIAERVGYSSETAFSQAFKRQFSFSPTQYRQQHLDQQ